ncbi:MAG: WD40/YVTN/BNR-like repeat-containing protein [Actinomycetota bacterium]
MSRTGGNTWQEITPRKERGGIHDLDFLTRQRGWLVANDCAAADAFLYHTRDRGKSWRRTPLKPASCSAGSILVIDFVDRSHGWFAYLSLTGEDKELRRTFNGGRTWERTRDLPAYGLIDFQDRRIGYLIEHFSPGHLYRSEDGGRTWKRQRVRPPANYDRAHLSYGLPSFFNRFGVLPVGLRRHRRVDTAFYVSDDGGRTWKFRSVIHTNVWHRIEQFAGPEPSSIVDPKVWWVLARKAPYVEVSP